MTEQLAIPPFILASASPRRRQLLAAKGLQFRIIHAEVEEWEPEEADPVEQVEENARRKARAVALQFPDAIVLAADTTVALGRQLLAKPENLEHARQMLALLSGRTHTVVSGVCLRQGQRERVFHDRCDVTFKDLSAADIEAYVRDVHVLDKAGAYAIQDGGERIVARYEGVFETIMGLPVEHVCRELQAFVNAAG
jgi:septum formation protein